MTVPRWLAPLLVVLTAGRHQFVDLLAATYDDPDRARRALFYAAGGVVSAALYAVVWHLCPRRPVVMSLAVGMACLWGILEETQVAVCRFAAGIDKPVTVPMWRGICDSLTGAPLSTVVLALPVCIAYLIAQGGRHD